MNARAPSSRRRFLGRKAIWITVAVIAALAIGLPTVTLGRLQGRILRLLTAELGRPVTAQSAHLVLLPWPGVELDQAVLADAPGFGGEALATAQTARATVRLWALFGGRLEFSSVHLDQANINLARNAAGNWNLAVLLNQVRRAGPRLRPTAARASLREAGRFPYLAIQNSRINFKFGLRKEPFYLTAVSASLSLARQGWRFHLRFSPQRSDLDLSDTGVATVDGIWFRPPPNRPARHPLSFDLAAHWRGAYLAAASALLLGHDGGIHGVARLDLRIRGTIQRLRLSGIAAARQLRRWDQLPSNLRVEIPFAAIYDSRDDTVRLTRLGGGAEVGIQGKIASLLTHPAPDLTLTVRQLPTAAMLPLARALDPGLPPDLNARGVWNGSLRLAKGADAWSARGQITAAAASLSEGRIRLRLEAPACRAVPTAVLPPGAGGLRGRRAPAARLECTARQAQISGPDHARAALRLAAEVTRRGVEFGGSGDRVSVPDVAALGQLFGVAAPWPYQLSGAAKVEFHRNLSWAAIRGYAPPSRWRGRAIWRRASLRLPVLSAPLTLENLEIQTEPSAVLSLRTQARLGGTAWRVVIHRAPDGEAGSASWSFSVRAAQASLARLAAALQPRAPRGFLARLFSHPATWLSALQLVHARGQLAIGDVLWQGHHAALRTTIAANGPNWRFPAVYLGLAGGAVTGQAAFQNGALRFRGQGRGLRLGTLLAHSAYAGALRGRGRLELRLSDPLPAASGAVARGQLAVRSGAFPLLRTPDGRPLRFARYQTDFHWRQGRLRLTRGRLWLTAHSQPEPVTVRFQPPLPPRLDWATPIRRTALVGAWPSPAPAALGPTPPESHHAHPN